MAPKSRIKEVEQPNGSVPTPAQITTPESKPRDRGIIVPQPIVAIARVKIVGDTPLICSAFPDKLKKQMAEDRRRPPEAPHQEAGGTKKKGQKTPRPARDFEKEFRDSLYPIPEADGSGNGMPAIAFKRAMVGACRNVDGLAMTDANRLIYVVGDAWSKGQEVVRIDSQPIRREDVTRVGQDKAPELAYRAEFWPWSCYINVKFFPNRISWPQLFNLIQWAGLTEGIGEMRPSAPKKSFNFGQFHPVNED